MKTVFLLLPCALLDVADCGKKEHSDHGGHSHGAHAHEHKAPHEGTPVVLGNEAYHLELVLDAAAGKLSAYVLDGEMEKYIRIAAPSFEIVATLDGAKHPLTFMAVADSATGETVGSTSLFEATAEWLKTAKAFDAVLTKIEIRGSTFADVPFNFPKGNE